MSVAKMGIVSLIVAGGLAFSAFLISQGSHLLGNNPIGNAGNAATGVKDATDTISGNPTTNSIASQSDTYRGTKAIADSTSSLSHWAGLAWAVVKVLLKVGAVILVVALITRTISRRRRTYVTYEIRPHRETAVSTEQLNSFMSTLNNTVYVRARRLQRLFIGAPSFALRLIAMPAPHRGTSEVISYITVPGDKEMNRELERSLANVYQDAQFIKQKPGTWPTWGTEIVRNKKTRPIPTTIRVPGISQASESFQEGFNSPVIDQVVTNMAGRDTPVELQIVGTPAPRFMSRLVRFLSRTQHGAVFGGNDPVSRSEGQNTTAGSVNDAQVFVEMRVGSPAYSVSRDVGAALQGAAGGDAQLRERRPVLRKRLYQERFHKGVGNPLPSWLHGVYSTSELSSLWQLPSSHLRAVTTRRTNRRRVGVPPEVHYVDKLRDGDLAAMWLSPENRPLALLKEDARLGIAAVGQQGAGKTVLMARQICALIGRDPNFSGLICDPKGDLAEAVLRMMPPGRRVLYIDAANPLIGIDPFAVADLRDEEAIVDVIVHGIIDVVRTEDDSTQIMASSKDFIRTAVYATLATTIPFGIRPTFHHLKKWISPDPKNVAWRQSLLNTVIGSQRSKEFIVDSYAEFHASLEASPGAFTQRAAAPLNKISELDRGLIDKILRHDTCINLEEAIKSGDVIIVNGRNRKSADIVFRLLWQMVDQTLGRLESQRKLMEQRIEETGNGELPPEVNFLFAVDESPSILTPTTADIIARRRSAGLHMILGWQYDAQIGNPKVLASLQALLQNTFQFRTGPDDARERVRMLQMTYDDQQDSRIREMRMNRVSVADLINLDRFHFYVFQLVHGNRVPAYWGMTINPNGSRSYMAEHLARIRATGGKEMGVISPPDFKQESDHACSRMTLDPPKFLDPNDGQAAVGDPGTNFEALRVNDERPAPGEGSSTSSMGENGSSSDSITPGESRSPAPPPKPKVEDPVGDLDVPFDRDEALADVSAATDKMRAPGEKATRPVEVGALPVGPLGPRISEVMSGLLECVDQLEDVKSSSEAEETDPPASATPSSVSGRNNRANELASNSKLIPPKYRPILLWIYEFNFLSTKQIRQLTKLSDSSVSTKMNDLLAQGVVKKLSIGRQKIWTLTDLGVRVGRHMATSRGPLIPFEPGKGEQGRHEAARKWAPRKVTNARALVHDLHVASYALQFVLLCDGDFRYVNDPHAGIVRSMTGEFGAMIEPPVNTGRNRQKTTMNIHQAVEKIGDIAYQGIPVDEPTLRSLKPDAAIRLHHLKADPKAGSREYWFEIDRSGHTGKLKDKFHRLDVFQNVWWPLVPRFGRDGRAPTTVFVATSEAHLKKMIGLADETLRGRSGRRREGPEAWRYLGRERIVFALESDLHMGSLRVYQVPAVPPDVRARNASDTRERTEAANCHPRMAKLLPDYLLAGRRDGTHEPTGY